MRLDEETRAMLVYAPFVVAFMFLIDHLTLAAFPGVRFRILDATKYGFYSMLAREGEPYQPYHLENSVPTLGEYAVYLAVPLLACALHSILTAIEQRRKAPAASPTPIEESRP